MEHLRDPHTKVYPAGGNLYSISDLLHSITDPEYMVDGLPRISDYHFKVGEPIRYRLDSSLVSIPGGEALTQEAIEGLIFPLLVPERIAEIQAGGPIDIDCGYEFDGDEEKYNFRLNVFQDRHGMAATMRMLPPKPPSIERVGFPYDDIWEDLVSLKQGLVLISGITGSGKSTTIASILNHINETRPDRIITLEDPIEYLYESKAAMISQREVGVHVESFARGLRSALREDPDMIFVGEIRDVETAALAISAAETGHLVFSTVHTRDAIGSVTRLIDMFPTGRERELTTQLSMNLRTVISQKLVPSATGKGRIIAMEVLRNIAGVGNLIRSGKIHQLYSSMETKGSEGMITMEQALLELYNDGKITAETALAFANREEIADRL
ncbi:type IV pilus twitching motility protein PilT [Cerasicoccus arenae]|uniref:Twitching motility protein PilT n=1 Tax=Cerasicoccus arenae TaxID=424488 RepID=A0A8J3GCM3_9BACT|nr:PilT/PilU family type 4a pilus ATPase [Cerasicoccus arenae]MBK1856801.1 PilT/PilU family type 4a pilus ATPase [Cerasicoccus arenae]GHB99595.1 twitching motility protein PilT [Cerasicoccus arenae]